MSLAAIFFLSTELFSAEFAGRDTLKRGGQCKTSYTLLLRTLSEELSTEVTRYHVLANS